jgi:hypothetical protein
MQLVPWGRKARFLRYSRKEDLISAILLLLYVEIVPSSEAQILLYEILKVIHGK